MTLEKDFIEFIELLNKHEVEYLVVGGYAMGLHGVPRTTGDIDFWIRTSESNAEKMVQVIDEFGFSSLGLANKDFSTKNAVIQLGYEPLRIDILNDIDGVEFSQAIKDKHIFQHGNIEIPFIGIRDFIKNKKAVGRKQDIEDLMGVEKKSKAAQKRGGKNRKQKPR